MRLDWPRALVTGGAAGLMGGVAFGWWMEREGFYPFLGGAAGHYLIAAAIGASFAVVFQKRVVGTGAALGWGLAWGMVWWVLGPLTMLKVVSGQPVAWSLGAGREVFGALIAHLIYGLVVGVVYALADGLWLLLLVGSDPIRRERGSPIARVVQAIARGAQAGLLVCVPSIVLFGGASWGVLLGSVAWGAAFGLLYRNEARPGMAGVAWGLVHGYVGWLVLPLTLLPLLDGDACRWSVGAAGAAWPLLAPHLLQGALLAVAYGRLAGVRGAGRPAPALWALVLGVQLLLVCALQGG